MSSSRIAKELCVIARELVGASDIETKAKGIADKINRSSKVLEVKYEVEEKRPGTVVVYFRVELKADPYVNPEGGVSVSNKFRNEMEAACKNAFGEEIDWNNTGTTGWVYIREQA